MSLPKILPITRALVHTSLYGDGASLLEPLVRQLSTINVEIVSLGKTATFIESLGIPIVTLDRIVQFTSLYGFVTALHPKIIASILAQRDLCMPESLPFIDLVVVDIPPFEDVYSPDPTSVLHAIDLDRMTLLLAAIKNYKHVAIVSGRGQYALMTDYLSANKGTTLRQRKELATVASSFGSLYHQAIHKTFCFTI